MSLFPLAKINMIYSEALAAGLGSKRQSLFSNFDPEVRDSIMADGSGRPPAELLKLDLAKLNSLSEPSPDGGFLLAIWLEAAALDLHPVQPTRAQKFSGWAAELKARPPLQQAPTGWPIDVFVCYTRPTPAPDGLDLGQWSRELVAALDDYVNPTGFGDVGKVTLAIDRPDTLEQCALLLVLLSPELLVDPERLGEIERFRQRAAQDGRTIKQTVLATVAPITVKPDQHPALDWLLQRGTRALNGEGFFDPVTGQPLEAQLEPALKSLAGEIRKALKPFRPDLAEKASPTPPTGAKAQIYLVSAGSEASWSDTRKALESVAIVNPARWPAPPTFAMMKAQNEERIQYLVSCRGMVLLRSAAEDKTDIFVSRALKDNDYLKEQDFPTLPFVLVDWVPDNGPNLQNVAITRVTTDQADWATTVGEALGL